MDENVSDALKIAAAVLLFVIALSVAVMAFTKARQAASSVMDKLASSQTYYDTDNISLGGNSYQVTSYRKVGKEIVIPTMYAYYEQGYTVLFYVGKIDADGNIIADSVQPLTIYYTEALDTKLQESSMAVWDKNTSSNSRAIYGIDTNDEITRQEPWSNNKYNSTKFIDALVNSYGNEDLNPSYITSRNGKYGNGNYFASDSLSYKLHFCYSEQINNKSLIENTGNFIERIGQYSYGKVGTTGNETGTYTTFNNNQTMINLTGTTKRVIQYIYIK